MGVVDIELLFCSCTLGGIARLTFSLEAQKTFLVLIIPKDPNMLTQILQ